jgi:hypothetical protein
MIVVGYMLLAPNERERFSVFFDEDGEAIVEIACTKKVKLSCNVLFVSRLIMVQSCGL